MVNPRTYEEPVYDRPVAASGSWDHGVAAPVKINSLDEELNATEKLLSELSASIDDLGGRLMGLMSEPRPARPEVAPQNEERTCSPMLAKARARKHQVMRMIQAVHDIHERLEL